MRLHLEKYIQSKVEEEQLKLERINPYMDKYLSLVQLADLAGYGLSTLYHRRKGHKLKSKHDSQNNLFLLLDKKTYKILFMDPTEEMDDPKGEPIGRWISKLDLRSEYGFKRVLPINARLKEYGDKIVTRMYRGQKYIWLTEDNQQIFENKRIKPPDIITNGSNSNNGAPIKNEFLIKLDLKQQQSLESYYKNFLKIQGMSTRENFGMYAVNIPLLSVDEELELARIIKVRGEDYAEAVRIGMQANFRLVMKNAIHSDALSQYKRGIDFMDLIQEGILGSREGLIKFDLDNRNEGDERENPYKFSTYINRWIKKHITRLIQSQERTIRIPVRVSEANARISKYKIKTYVKSGKTPTLEEIAKETILTEDKIHESEYLPFIFSMEEEIPNKEAKQFYWKDTFRSATPSPERIAIENSEGEANRSKLSVLLKYITSKEAEILKMRYEIGDESHGYTLEEVANELSLTRVDVRKIEASGLRKLKRAAKRKELPEIILQIGI